MDYNYNYQIYTRSIYLQYIYLSNFARKIHKKIRKKYTKCTKKQEKKVIELEN